MKTPLFDSLRCLYADFDSPFSAWNQDLSDFDDLESPKPHAKAVPSGSTATTEPAADKGAEWPHPSGLSHYCTCRDLDMPPPNPNLDPSDSLGEGRHPGPDPSHPHPTALKPKASAREQRLRGEQPIPGRAFGIHSDNQSLTIQLIWFRISVQIQFQMFL